MSPAASSWVRMAFQRHRAQQEIRRTWAGATWSEAGFVFISSVGTPLQPDDISRMLGPLLKAAGLPKVRFHDLRHSCACLLLSLGVHAKLVQGTLGHSSYQLTTDIYSHVTPALRTKSPRVSTRSSQSLSEMLSARFLPVPQKPQVIDSSGAGRGGRTPTRLPSADFESRF